MENQINDSKEKTQVSNPNGITMCGLAILFRIFGVACIVLGLICAKSFTEEYSGYYWHTNYALVVIYIAGGLITGMFNFALAIIVDACDKYRKAH